METRAGKTVPASSLVEIDLRWKGAQGDNTLDISIRTVDKLAEDDIAEWRLRVDTCEVGFTA